VLAISGGIDGARAASLWPTHPTGDPIARAIATTFRARAQVALAVSAVARLPLPSVSPAA
jgi:hypothetical protein